MNPNVYSLLIVLVCAACTLLLRAAPFVLFRKGMPEGVRSLAMRMPAAIIAVLVVYCLKGVPSGTFLEGVISLACVGVVVALHLWRHNTLLSIAVGTGLYMALLHLI